MVALPVDKKARHLVVDADVSELVAARLLVAYHLAHQRPMMGSFLDALGIAHEDGVIADEESRRRPTPETLLQRPRRRSPASYPADDVALYLSTLLWQDPETWGALAGRARQTRRGHLASLDPTGRLERLMFDWMTSASRAGSRCSR